MADRDWNHASVRRPYGNSYWVEPGRVLAGEYPGGSNLAETRQRLQALGDCGVRCYIDLTRPRENSEYATLLDELSGGPFEHHRFPIQDHGVPDSPQTIVDALDAIDDAHRRGLCVYVHCRAGIGRTGMVVAAWLMRQGYNNVEAFDRLQLLWQQCARSNRWPIVPETPEQIDYVHAWAEAARAPAPAQDRLEGALTGLLVADALASMRHAGAAEAELLSGNVAVPPCLFADGAQTLAALESLIQCGRFDPDDQLQRYQQWFRAASAEARVQVPDALKRAVATWQWSRKAYAGSHDPKNVDGHTVARTTAVALTFRSRPEQLLELSADLSRTSQQSPIVLDVCRLFAASLLDALAGCSRSEVSAYAGPQVTRVRARKLRPEVSALFERGATARRSDRSAIALMTHAMNTLANHDDIEAGLTHLVTMKVSPSAAAVYGALAGAHAGGSRIPSRWREVLPQPTRVRTLLAGIAT